MAESVGGSAIFEINCGNLVELLKRRTWING
jgi:hypothetical protein